MSKQKNYDNRKESVMLNLMLTGKMHYIILYNEKINCAKYGTLQSDTAS